MSLVARASEQQPLTVTPTVALEIRKQSGQNTVAVADAGDRAPGSFARHLPAEARLDIVINNSVFIRASVEQVEVIWCSAILTVANVFPVPAELAVDGHHRVDAADPVIGAFTAVWAAGFT